MTKDEVLGMIILGKCSPGAIPRREQWRVRALRLDGRSAKGA
jgi:hypothetical protein